MDSLIKGLRDMGQLKASVCPYPDLSISMSTQYIMTTVSPIRPVQFMKWVAISEEIMAVVCNYAIEYY